MKVKLVSATPDLLDNIYLAARTCYNEGSPIDMVDGLTAISEQDKIKLVRRCIKSRHHSVLEHSSFTFAIEGITRACSHQLVRHRLCSFSQQSQRFCSMDMAEFVKPEQVDDEYFERLMDWIKKQYKQMQLDGLKNEDARAILPNCTATNLVMTCNLRELIHMCEERLCGSAQYEIRQLMWTIVGEVCETEPWLAEFLQPKCVSLGKCTENKCCGYLKRYKEEQ